MRNIIPAFFVIVAVAGFFAASQEDSRVAPVQQPERAPVVVADTTDVPPAQVPIALASPGPAPALLEPHPYEGSVDTGNQCLACWRVKSDPIHDNNAHHKFRQSSQPGWKYCLLCGKVENHPVHAGKPLEYTEGPTPLTEAEFADLQKWLKDGKPLQEWVDAHPDPALKQAATEPLTLLNYLRPTPLRRDDQLIQAAQQYANLLARTRQQGHFADGDPELRARRAGFTGSLRTPGRVGADGWTHYGVGEVLAFGHRDAAEAIGGWLLSPDHKAALLEPSFDVAGFGQNGTVWVGMFGNSTATAQPPASTPAAPVARYSQPGNQRRGIFRRWRH